MAWRGDGGRRPPRRALRLGDRGEEVAWLQERLRELGFDPGPPDGIFGVLTVDALREFQRENRLRVDGIAGRRVIRLLSDPDSPSARLVHRVAPKETVESIARGLGVSPQVLRRANRLPPGAQPYPGQQLTLRFRTVVAWPAGWPAKGALARTFGRHGAGLSAVLRPLGRLEDAAGAAAGGETLAGPALLDLVEAARVGWLLNGDAGPPAPGLLKGRGGRAAAAARGGPGVLFCSLGRPAWGQGPGVTRLAAALAAARRGRGGALIPVVPLRDVRTPWRRLAADLDYGALVRGCPALVLVPPPPGRPGVSLQEEEALLAAVLRRAPAWKCLLALWVSAVDTGSSGWRLLPHLRAEGLAYRHRTRPRWDPEAARARFAYKTDGEERQVWLSPSRAVAARLEWIDRYNLAGVVLTRVGEEDPRLWGQLSRRLAVRPVDGIGGRGQA